MLAGVFTIHRRRSAGIHWDRTVSGKTARDRTDVPILFPSETCAEWLSVREAEQQPERGRHNPMTGDVPLVLSYLGKPTKTTVMGLRPRAVLTFAATGVI
jgi:hypothetical protein